ncbi:ABC transporter substrate-binding protein [Paenibacillus sepulcri]|uniref:Extracellular solute-binding protein n=1 Tax=Paenibacillus sepulcri TaxID=359917 RepID=A0ABS7CA41_9BACL|nr:extracellular solute-binding protein [Paenibacillus sepulcri]
MSGSGKRDHRMRCAAAFPAVEDMKAADNAGEQGDWRIPRRKWSGAAIIALLMIGLSLMGGCMDGPSNDKTASSLVIAVNSEIAYDSDYRDYLEAAFPDLKFRLVEMKIEPAKEMTGQLKQFMQREQPDLIIGVFGYYVSLANSGLLENLSVRLKGSGISADDFQPGVIERLKQTADGELYGLAGEFDAPVLVYNEDLFAKYAVELPHNDMTLPEIFELANSFARAGSAGDGVVGFHQSLSSMPADQLNNLALSEGIQAYNLDKGKMTIDTPSWKIVFQTVVDMYRAGTLMMQDVKTDRIGAMEVYGPEAVAEADLFKQAKSAMTLADHGQYAQTGFRTGEATPPVTSSDRSRTYHIYVPNIMSIRSGSPNADEAWEVIRFMNSDHMAKVRANLKDDGFSSLKTYQQYDREPVVDELYELHSVPLPTDVPPMSLDVEMKFFNQLAELENREITAVVKKEKTLDAAIQVMQKEGQFLLNAAMRAE